MTKSRGKLLSIVIVIIFTSSITLFICRDPLTLLTLEFINSARMISNEKLTECFDSNKSDFESVSKLIDANPNILQISSEKSSLDNNRLYSYTTKNKMYVESEKELNNNELDDIDKSGATKIIKNLKFITIQHHKDEIDFMQATSLAEAKGIIYIPDKDKYNNKYYELKEIKDKWYIYDYK